MAIVDNSKVKAVLHLDEEQQLTLRREASERQIDLNDAINELLYERITQIDKDNEKGKLKYNYLTVGYLLIGALIIVIIPILFLIIK